MSRPVPRPPAADAVPEPAAPGAAEGPGASRRSFIGGVSAATVAGAAVAAVATAGPAAAATTASATTSGASAEPSGRVRRDAVVAYVRDASTGEIRIMSGDREVVVHDRALARTLTRHADAQES
jgi:hypothetical protein